MDREIESPAAPEEHNPSGAAAAPASAAVSVPERQRRRHATRQIVAVLIFLAVAGAFALSFRMAVVHGDSMLPTYHNGQVLLVGRLRALTGPLKKGDVVLVRRDNDVIIKRVAYLPGEEIPQQQTLLFIRVHDYFQYTRVAQFPWFKLRVPPGYVVVLGDNRRVSEDSRVFGPVPLTDILGSVINAVPYRPESGRPLAGP